MVLVGIVLAIVAVILVSRVADESGGRAGPHRGADRRRRRSACSASPSPSSATGDVFADLSVIRLVQLLLVVGAVLVTRSAWRPGRDRCSCRSSLIGVLDTAGNGFYLAAVQTGQLAIASVLSAMYPVVTVILAAVVLREPVTRDHTIGIGLAGVAIALIGAGGA